MRIMYIYCDLILNAICVKCNREQKENINNHKVYELLFCLVS